MLTVLYMDLESYGDEDLLTLLQADPEINLVRRAFKNTPDRSNPVFEKELGEAILEAKADIVFSFNYFPLISKSVQAVYDEAHALYVSWIYDCPHVSLFSCTLINPCNRVFIFDSSMYLTFARQGIPHVYYLPLAVNTDRLDAMQADAALWQQYQAKVSFVGGLYTESHTFYDRMEEKLDPYTKGYLEALMRAQMNVSGINFIQDSITPMVEAGMWKALPMDPNPDGVETTKYLYAEYVINRKITQTERSALLTRLGEEVPTVLYTRDKTFTAEGVTVRGPIDYYNMAPYVFKCSDINLNISLRSIHSGIPLRAFDIMGAGGFLLTNYQEDFLNFFVPGEDFVYYEDADDLVKKVKYYLEHDYERDEIAHTGYAKIREEHTFHKRLAQILDVVLNGD